MFKCPNRVPGSVAQTFDEHMENFDFHFNKCTCFIMDLYLFSMVEQDDHIRAYWESLGLLEVRGSIKWGVLLRYPLPKNYVQEIGYPY